MSQGATCIRVPASDDPERIGELAPRAVAYELHGLVERSRPRREENPDARTGKALERERADVEDAHRLPNRKPDGRPTPRKG